MKKILITGAGSYIGTAFDAYIKKNFKDQYTVDTVDMLDRLRHHEWDVPLDALSVEDCAEAIVKAIK